MANLRTPVNEKDYIQGDPNAKIELVEYGDYECPHCGHAYPIVKNLQKKLGTNLKLIYRNFPLSESHPHAFHSALAALAAGRQDRFWEMHDLLFEQQNNLEDDALVGYAQKLKLDLPRFQQDFESPELTKQVEADFESGIRSGVNGTPSFFINGIKYDGDWDEQPFLEHLQSLHS